RESDLIERRTDLSLVEGMERAVAAIAHRGVVDGRNERELPPARDREPELALLVGRAVVAQRLFRAVDPGTRGLSGGADLVGPRRRGDEQSDEGESDVASERSHTRFPTRRTCHGGAIA